MSIKLTGNGLWESSRLILPEHKAALAAYLQKSKEKTKPLLDADVIEDIERKIAESLTQRTEITLQMFDLYEDLCVTGVVDRIDTYGQRLMVDGEGFRMADIIG